MSIDDIGHTVKGCPKLRVVSIEATRKEWQTDFNPAEVPETGEKAVEYLNRFFFFVSDKSGVQLGRFVHNIEGYDEYAPISERDLKLLLGMKVSPLPDSSMNKPVEAWKAWFEDSRNAFFYKGHGVFVSRPCPSETLNLWRGWTITPEQGNWSQMQDHILDILCGGHIELYHFLIAWCANLYQHPDEPGQTNVVLQGDQGTGKGIFCKWLGAPFGGHYLHMPVATISQVNSTDTFKGNYYFLPMKRFLQVIALSWVSSRH